jgi:hypothetical protein
MMVASSLITILLFASVIAATDKQVVDRRASLIKMPLNKHVHFVPGTRDLVENERHRIKTHMKRFFQDDSNDPLNTPGTVKSMPVGNSGIWVTANVSVGNPPTNCK